MTTGDDWKNMRLLSRSLAVRGIVQRRQPNQSLHLTGEGMICFWDFVTLRAAAAAELCRSAAEGRIGMHRSFAMATACLVLAVGGCANGPGSMSKSEVEAKLKDTLGLDSVSLSEQPEGGYAGTGQGADGAKYTITVAQKKADRSLWYMAMSEQGELKGGGFKEFGSPWLRKLDQFRKAVMVLTLLFVVVGGGYVAVRRLTRRPRRSRENLNRDSVKIR